MACDDRGRPTTDSNLGNSIGRRGLSALGVGVTSLAAEGEPLTLSGTSVAAPFCDRSDRPVVVEISRGERRSSQTCRHPRINAAASLGCSPAPGRRGGLSRVIGCMRAEERRMTKTIDDRAPPAAGERQPRPLRLPGFVGDEEIGLGDAIKRAASYFGASPCGGCEQRRAALNRWVTFGGPRR